MPYIGTCFRFYTQMRVQKNSKAFAYRIYSHFTQQCTYNEKTEKTHISINRKNSKALNDNVEQTFRGPFMNREKRRPRSSTSDLIWANNLSYKDNLLLISLPFSEKNPKISSKDDGTWDFNCHLVRVCEWMSCKESKIIGYICKYSPWILRKCDRVFIQETD